MERYVLVLWPESQHLMEKDWFRECILVPIKYFNDWVGSSAYFVPEERFFEEDFETGSSLIFYVDKGGNVIEIENPL
jgi:hypothetical protein